MRKTAVISLVGCAGSAAVIGWIPCLLLRLVVRIQIPHSVAWLGSENADLLRCPVFICYCLPLDRTWPTVNNQKFDYSGRWGKGRSGSNRDSNPARLYWSSAYLGQYELDEPCWTWTQTWVQAWMADYSWNWTMKFNGIQCCQWNSHSPEGGPDEATKQSALNLSLTLNTAPSRSSVLFVTPSHQIGLDTKPITRRPTIVGGLREGEVGLEPTPEPNWSMLIIGSLGAMWAWWALLDMDLNMGQAIDIWL